MKKSSIILKWFMFFLIVVSILEKLTPYYANRTGTDYNYRTFQNMQDNPEVLIFGSSLTECSISPNDLYKRYGITSYNLSAPGQYMDTTEYVMDVALSYKTPKVVIISTDYINDISKPDTLNNEIIGIRELKGKNVDKWKYLYNHFGLKSMEYIKFLLPVFQFHSDLLNGKIQNQTNDDYKQLKKLYQKGYSYYSDVTKVDLSNALNCEQKAMSEESICFVKTIVEKCHKKGVEVVFLTMPTKDGFQYDNAIKDNFQDCGYVNFNKLIDEIGIDGETDFLNIDHLNLSGAEKVTNYLGMFLTREYELLDYRNQKDNNLWNITLPVFDEHGYENYDDEIWQQALEDAGYDISFVY